MGKPMVKSELVLNQFKEDLNETRPFYPNESNSYILDESHRLDDS